MIRTVFGIKARFCDKGCQDSYRCDREAGLIYPPYKVGDQIMGVDEASIEADFCAYCGQDAPEEQQPRDKV